MNFKKIILSLLVISAAIMFTSCGGNSGSSSNGSDSTSTADNSEILAAGSSFVNPLFSKMFSVYNQQKGIKVNYQSIGSGGGIKQLQNKIVDFGASDNPLSDEQMYSISISYNPHS